FTLDVFLVMGKKPRYEASRKEYEARILCYLLFANCYFLRALRGFSSSLFPKLLRLCGKFFLQSMMLLREF
ncbi:MAG: hypothetical protein LBJ90_03370, partial [Treponema sp.]|nr:hypothetical protein [Treponema sp.]